MKINHHILDDINYIPSPNADERPDEKDINLIVIHCICLPPDDFSNPKWVDQLFTNQLTLGEHPFYADIIDLKVSAHLYIQRDGSITQYVPFNRRAWHAGVSSYEGRERCNDYSIGIELEGSDHTEYTDIQYVELSNIIKCLLSKYPSLNKQRITAHSDIAPGRKTDPGEKFDWQRLCSTL